MTRTRWLIGTAFLLGILLIVYFTVSTKTNVQLQCIYMAYACGDCYSQYRVQQVYAPSSMRDKLMNKDIAVVFDNARQEAAFNDKVGDCLICYVFDLRGTISFQS
jgi:hypothetical protein